jgi:hypothetical protein
VYATASAPSLTLIATWGADGRAELTYNPKRSRYELKLRNASPQQQPGDTVVVQTGDGQVTSTPFPIRLR